MTDEDLRKIGKLISESETRVVGEVGKFIEDSILPTLEEKADKSDIDRLERKLDNITAKDLEQDHRLDEIKSLPTIAHELKLKE